VPNPSFEIYDTCPNGFSSPINNAAGWNVYKGTPDYYNSCSPDTNLISYSVPSNWLGFQYARTGNGYGGLITFYQLVQNGREYIGIELTQPLIIGTRYYGSFYISRTYMNNANRYTISNNKMGMRLTTSDYSLSSPEPTNNYAQIYTDSIITDTLDWVRISGSFIADSSYRYLSIGNFFNDSLTSYVTVDSIAAGAYYYIDDVYLSDLEDSSSSTTDIYQTHFVNVSPNPFQGTLDFETGDNGISEIILYDIFGRNLVQQKFTTSIILNTDQFSQGIYFYKFKNENGIIRKGKIVKE
jgi:hypothetical protein